MLREHRFHLWGMLAWFVVLELLLAAAILFWPSFEENLGPLRAFAGPFEVGREIFDRLEQGGVVAYVNGQHFFKGCNAVGSLTAVVFAMGAIAGEAQRGTLEIMLARPLTRRRILFERWIAGALAVSLPVFATSATVPWLLGFVDEEMSLGPLMLASAQQSALLLSVYSVTFLFSCIGSRPIVLGFSMMLFVLFEFGIYIIKYVTHGSIFRLTDIGVFQRIVNTQALDWRLFGPLVAVVALALLASHLVFARRVP
jgi:ABC-type transport system involved in multi-copper enzyme maturation permease subunit